MKRLFFPFIGIIAVVGFALQRPADKRLRIAPLADFPEQISVFRTVSGNNELLFSDPYTDGTVGLDRVYVDDHGTKLAVYIAPQILGQHAPPVCLNYSGDSLLALSQRVLPGDPAIIVNQISAQAPGTVTPRSCLYYWKTADGSFAPEPKHYVREMTWASIQHRPGVLVEICTEQAGSTAGLAMEAFAQASYPEAAKLYARIFGTNRP